MVMGGIVPVVNIDGVKAERPLPSTGPTLAKIFLGEIKTWDDAAIEKLNPTVKLPSAAIAVVHRSDGSGTTFNFTDYLVEGQRRIGNQRLARTHRSNGRPASAPRATKASPANVQQTKNSIGYVESAYAKQNKLTTTKMVNKDGKTVKPTVAAVQAAAANADWAHAPASI